MALTTAERVLMVTPYPPARDGIGAYALQQVRALRRAGTVTEVVSPAPSAADHHRDLIGPRGALALRSLARRFDRMIVQYHQDVFYERPSTPETRRSTSLALAAALRTGPPTTIVVHEIIGGWLDDDDPSAKATARMFRSAAGIDVHVPEHRDLLVNRAGVDPDRVRLIDHGADFERRTRLDRAQARAALDLPVDDHVLLCIGFVAAHKGFDRAIRAFRGLDEHSASLHVVGSVRVDDPIANAHRRELERLAAEIGGVHLHLGFVGDETFDRWIVAADTVVLPYRHIWSSSVVERAALYDRPVIATRVGGLGDQLAGRAGAVLVSGDDALRSALWRAVGATPDASSTAAGWDLGAPPSQSLVQAAIRERASARRGGPVQAGVTGAAPGPSSLQPLRRLPEAVPPSPVSARPGVSALKRLTRRLIGWEVAPLRDQVTSLQKATTEAVARLADRVEDR